MRPYNVKSVLIKGTQTLCMSPLLLEGAIHFAEQGYSVLYISAKEFHSLPPSLHGLGRPTPDVFSFIRFMYLPSWQDLLQHLCSLHVHSHMPSVLIVESLDLFLKSGSQVNPIDPPEISHITLLFAALLDGAAVCATKSKKVAHLVVSIGLDIPCPLSDIFFSDVVLVCETEQHKDGEKELNVELQNLERKTKLKFVFHKNALILSKVSMWDNLVSS